MGKDNDAVRVIMFPWLAFGHIMPFFQLSIAIAKAGIRVSFVSTPRNIQRLPKLPTDIQTLIKLVSLPLPALDKEKGVLPEGGEATVDISFDQIQYLKVAYDLLRQPFKQLVEDESPDWIIIDFAPCWVPEIAQEYHVCLMMFSVFSSATYSFVGPPEYLVGDGQKRVRSSPESLTSPPEWFPFPSTIAFHGFEAKGFHSGFYGQNASGITDSERVAKILLACQVVAIRSCHEYETEYLTLFQNIIGKPVIPVGLLPPERSAQRSKITDGEFGSIFGWLDQRSPRSVVFVGFGSECKLSKVEVHEIAYGLELSGLPFLWALRNPTWAADEDGVLPSGFTDRTARNGMVFTGWVPQLEILAHSAIGGSLFHAGWGSVIETLQFGHCLILLPFIIDQGLNARYLVEKGLGVEVERSEDGSFSRHVIAKALRLAMVSEEGEALRVSARETAKLFGDHKLHQDHYIGGFVEFLKNGDIPLK